MKKINFSRKSLINSSNTDDSECLKWHSIGYLYLPDCDLGIIRKSNKIFARKVDFKDKKVSCQSYRYSKSREKNCISINVFGIENRGIFPI